MAAHVRKDDTVEVIAGDHRGASGKVLRVIQTLKVQTSQQFVVVSPCDLHNVIWCDI